MRIIGILAIASGLALADAAFPGAAGAQSAVPDSAAAAEPARVDTSVAAPTPPPLPPRDLQREIGAGPVRVRLGYDQFVPRHASPGQEGLRFGPRDVGGVSTHVPGGGYWMEKRPAAPASPIPWDRVDRIERRKSSAMRGALVGMVLLPAIWVAQFAATDQLDELSSGDMAELGQIIVFGGGATAGAAAGALIGAFVPHWERVWQRPVTASGAAR